MKIKRNIIDSHFIIIVTILIVLLVYIFGFKYIEEWIYSVWPYEIGYRAEYSLPKLSLEFIKIVVIACLISTSIGVGVGIFCFTKSGNSFIKVIDKIAMIMQTIPAMAVLMFGMLAFGIGMKAAVFALILQSLLPVVFSTISGIKNVPQEYIEIGKGLGMTDNQILKKVRIPIALPVILSGIRISLIICVGTATLAFSTGAGGLGLLIQTGVSTYNTVYIMEGTIPICLIAIFMDQFVRKIEKHMYKIDIND